MIQSIVGHLAAVDFRAALEQAYQQASPEQRAAGQLNFRLQVENVAKIAVAYADATMATVFRPKG